MAEQAHATYELVEVKAEDIVAERQSFYAGFMSSTKAAIGVTVAALVLMAIFLV